MIQNNSRLLSPILVYGCISHWKVTHNTCKKETKKKPIVDWGIIRGGGGGEAEREKGKTLSATKVAVVVVLIVPMMMAVGVIIQINEIKDESWNVWESNQKYFEC